MDVQVRRQEPGKDNYYSKEESNENTNHVDNTVDWRGRSSDPQIHGGMKAASFVLGLQCFEIMGIAAVGNNLITYVINEMHFSLAKSANTVTNFVGTVFLLALLGGYLSDSFLGSFWTMLIFGFIELSGFILLSVQAHLPQLKPPKCSVSEGEICEEAKGFKAMIFFMALYLVALGSGCVKPNMIAHGADQFSSRHAPKKLSSYFNAAYFAFSLGELVALTLLVYVQTHSGMDVGFGVSAASMALGLISLVSGLLFYRNKPPQGSIFTPIARVFVAAILNRKRVSHHVSFDAGNPLLIQKFRFLEKACMRGEGGKESRWRACTGGEVEQVKRLVLVMPMLSCTIMFNTILAQLQTFSVQQGSVMETRIFGSFRIPPASLQAIPYLMLIFLVPLYAALFVPFARKLTGHASGLAPPARIGAGLFLATFSMIAAALVEHKRRASVAAPLSIFWIAPQFLIFGLSEMFTAVGLIEFFYKQSLHGSMQAFLTASTYCSYSFGFYLSSLLVMLVNKLTASSETHRGWLSDNDLNKDRLDLFYCLLALLSFLNFLTYLFWANWYSHADRDTRQDISKPRCPNSNNNNNVVDIESVP